MNSYKYSAIMKKLYEKSEILFAVVWIAAYCVLLSVGDSLSASLGVEKSVTLPIGALTADFYIFFRKF